MSISKRIDGKNAVLIIDSNDISVIYKNAFGEVSNKNSKRFNFTYDDVDEIEYKKPGISMNGFILIVLKNADMHKIVLNKLDEYSLEITDEFVKELECKLGIEEEPSIIIKQEEKEVKPVVKEEPKPVVVINPEPMAIFPKKEEPKKKEEEKKDSIKVTPKAINVAYTPITVVKPKSKEEIEKDKLREEIKRKVEEKRESKTVETPMIVKGNRIYDDSVEIPSIPQRPKVFIREEKKEEVKTKPTIKRIVTKENSPKEEEKKEPIKVNEPTLRTAVVQDTPIVKPKEVVVEEKPKVKEEVVIKEPTVIAVEPKKEIEKEKEKPKSKPTPLQSFINKINLSVGKDKTKTEEFSKDKERKVSVGTVEINHKGKEVNKVPVEVSVRPLKKEEIEELEKKKNDVIIDELKHKLYIIESELATLHFELLALQKHIDTTYDIEEIKKLIAQIEDLIKVLEAIKQELINKMNGKNYVANKALDVTGDDIVNIDDFKTIYVKALDRINEFEVELETVKDKTLERKKEIEITEKEFEDDQKNLKEKKDLVSKYDDFIQRTRMYAEALRPYIGTEHVHTVQYYVRNIRELREDTRMLAALSAASLAVPGMQGVGTTILTTATGIAAMRDAIIPTETRTVTQDIYTPVDYSSQINKGIREVNEAATYINNARKDISDIKKELKEKYKTYPDYKEILDEFDKLEVEIDRQEKELNTVIYTINGEITKNNNQKILILEKEDDQ